MIALSETAATLVVAACRSWWAHGPEDTVNLWMTVEDYLAEQLEDAARPSGDVVPILSSTQRAILVAMLRTLSPDACKALYLANVRYWDIVDASNHAKETLGIPFPSQRELLAKAGFQLEPE